jgi:hypothetical protein
MDPCFKKLQVQILVHVCIPEFCIPVSAAPYFSFKKEKNRVLALASHSGSFKNS